MLNVLRRQEPKLDALCVEIEKMGQMVIAFSGGVDSTFLVRIASELLGAGVLALTVNAPYIANWEIEEAKALTQKLGAAHTFLEATIPEAVKNNPEDRCYLCKKVIFSAIKAFAAEKGIQYVCDGSNADDVGDYRPGMRALKELDIKSPLMAMGVTKAEIRAWSKALGLETWDKPPYACLLTRLPYNTLVTIEDLQMIEAAEHALIQRGIRAVRVRKHGDIARIEMDFSQVLEVSQYGEIAAAIKAIGFKYVTLDLEGYTMGSFNRDIRGV